MVVGAFPVFKLGVLAFKQLSKPIANVLKERAKNHPFFRTYICIPPAQFYNWMEVKTKMWVLNLGKPGNVPPLNETMAIELGANLLGEAIIFSIGSGLLLLEFKRQSNKETAKEEIALQEKRELQSTLQELALNIERQDAQIRHLMRTVAEIESRTWLPKIKLRSSSKEGEDGDAGADDRIQKLKRNINREINSTHTDNSSNNNKTVGNYNPNDGLLFESLNLIENEIIYSDQSTKVNNGHRIIADALAYLKL